MLFLVGSEEWKERGERPSACPEYADMLRNAADLVESGEAIGFIFSALVSGSADGFSRGDHGSSRWYTRTLFYLPYDDDALDVLMARTRRNIRDVEDEHARSNSGREGVPF